jgi:hypothetical protein
LDAPYDFDVYLYNNLFYNLSIESTVKDEVWDIENFPYILIEGEGMVPSVSKLSTVNYVITPGYKRNEYKVFRYSL